MRYFVLLVIAACLSSAAPAVKSDSGIELDFRSRLSRSKLAADGIQIRVHGGVATLTGHTSVVQHKGTATRMAKSSGATTVVNRIEISEAARQAAAEKLASGRKVTRTEQRTERPGGSERTRPQSIVPKPVPADSPVSQTAVPGPPPVRRAQIRH